MPPNPAEVPLTDYSQHLINSESEPVNPRVETLEMPLRKILLALKERLNNGEVNLLIGDDASGRSPALIIKKVVDEVYEEKNIPKPGLIFIAGGETIQSEDESLDEIPEINQERVKKIKLHLEKLINQGLIAEKSNNLHKTVLIITEGMFSGYGLRELIQALRKIGLPTEVVSVYVPSDASAAEFEDRLGVKIYHGTTDAGLIVALHEDKTASGVSKKPGQIFAQPHTNETGTRENLQPSRNSISNVAARLTAWYEQS